MGGTWQLWLTSAAVAAVVTGLANLPKMLAERRKTNAETDGERFDNYKEITDASLGELRESCARCNARLEKVEDVLKAVAALNYRGDPVIDALITASRRLI